MSTLVALLGPTNTGKTHRAVERMLEHDSGMIGLPLRLLAREIYDRITARIGEQEVALVTGEEKRVGKRPRYWICTTESMPVDRAVDFVAIDEVQLAAHPQRGHVFTDRMLHARGRLETWLLGADTIAGMVAELLPSAERRRHPRLSKLAARGVTTLGTLPPRSAVIAFSAAEVYALAERLRRRRGGAAVVLGALSPRTRNAQVAMYQSGEVDFLVATDAIGMGLNLDVDHIAFAALRKFDGTRMRQLTLPELAQIAGRAGRYTRDGTFGTVAPIEIPSEAIFAIEEHRFEPITRMMWRNSDLDHSSIDALLASLAVRPRERGLVLADDADDETALRMLSERPEVRARARGADGVRLLWDVCRIPDFRKLLPEHHVTMLAEIHAQLSGPRGQLEADFMHERISRLEDTRGDIDTLMMRMEFIRTWNYIAHHSHWVVDAPVWQQRTQWAEDRLSEALHQQLVARFVEQRRRTRRSRPGNTTKQRGAPEPEHERDDGPFAGLRAMRDKMLPAEDALITDEICEQIVLTEHEDLDLDKRGNVSIAVDGERLHIATLARGSDLLHPEPKLAALELGPGGRARVLRRMRAYLRDLMNDALAPFRDERLAGLTAVGRGLQYQLEQGLGNVAVRDARTQLAGLPSADRQLFVGVGLSFGSRYVFAETLLTPRAIERRVALCHPYAPSFAPDGDATVVALARDVDRGSVEAMGFAALDAHAVRIDVVEQLSERLAELATHAPFGLPPALVALLETSHDDAERIVTAMGYPRTSAGFIAKRRRSRRSRRGR